MSIGAVPGMWCGGRGSVSVVYVSRAKCGDVGSHTPPGPIPLDPVVSGPSVSEVSGTPESPVLGRGSGCTGDREKSEGYDVQSRCRNG